MSVQIIETLDPVGRGQYRSSRSWFLASGIGLLALGALAFDHLSVGTFIRPSIIGTIMLTGGALGIGFALGISHPYRHHFWIFSSLFYGFAGAAVLFEPVVGLRGLTLVMAISVGMSGLSRLVVGKQLRSGAILISGAASMIAATVIGIDWPEGSLWVVGLVVAIDLIVEGMTLLAAGVMLHLKARPKPVRKFRSDPRI